MLLLLPDDEDACASALGGGGGVSLAPSFGDEPDRSGSKMLRRDIFIEKIKQEREKDNKKVNGKKKKRRALCEDLP